MAHLSIEWHLLASEGHLLRKMCQLIHQLKRATHAHTHTHTRPALSLKLVVFFKQLERKCQYCEQILHMNWHNMQTYKIKRTHALMQEIHSGCWTVIINHDKFWPVGGRELVTAVTTISVLLCRNC